MNRRLLRGILVIGACLSLWAALPGEALAIAIGEAEANNSFATAQNLDGSFSTDLVPTIFNSTTVPHVSVSGTNAATSDVDYYRFTVPAPGMTGYFDIDCGSACPNPALLELDTTLSLFNAGKNLLAFNDDTDFPLDPGTVSLLDSFIGVYTFASAGTYYIAVSNCCNVPLGFGTFVGGPTRPDGVRGGSQFAGDSGPTSVDTTQGIYSGGDYILHASLSEASSVVPEPGTLLLLGSGLVGLGGATWLKHRRK